MQISILGIDIGKNSCSVVGVDERGAVVVRRTMRREKLIEFVEKLPICVIAMEACCGAHHLGRLFAARGHEIRLMSPEYVRPYVKAQKNDDRDAEGIAEAASRPTMRFVELKSQEQLDIQTLHRVRSRLVAERTTLINQMRAILLERGLVFAAGRCKFERAVDTLLEEWASGLSERVHRLVAELRDEWKVLDTKIAALNAEFLSLARDNLAARRLTTIPGIGVLNATALIAAIGNASGFDRARDLGAWLGLVPRQFTTGGKHGCWASQSVVTSTSELCLCTARGQWLRGLLSRGMHRNVVIVALANKLARIAWAVLRKDCPFERAYGATAA